MNAFRASMLAALAAIGCSSPGKPQPPTNSAPVISDISATPSSVSRGANATITATVTDPEGDALTYAWTLPAGFTTVSGEGTAQIVVTASSFASGLVELAVSDGAATTTGTVALSTIDGSWGTALALDAEYATADIGPRVAMDASGNGFAVWTHYEYINNYSYHYLWSSRYTPSTRWGMAPEKLMDYAESPDVAMDANGNAIVVIVERHGPSDSTSHVSAIRYAAGTWGTAEQISGTEFAPSSPRIAMNASGDAVAVWEQSDGTAASIWASCYTVEQGWGPARLIESLDVYAASPEVAMDASGNAIAVWTQRLSGAYVHVWANRYTAGTDQWGTAERLESDEVGNAQGLQVAMDPSGNAIAVWSEPDGIRENVRANRYTPGTGWDADVTALENGNGSAYYADVAMDASGNAIAVWSQLDDFYNVWANRYTVEAGWSGATKIEDDGGASWPVPRVAIDASGNAIALWQAYDGARYNVWASRYTVATGWGAPDAMDSTDSSAWYPQVAFDPSGNAVAVWLQGNASYDVWANAFH